MIENVKRGVKWLNENHPGWFNRIDIQQLEMENPFTCICGQLGIGDLPAVSGNTLDNDTRLSFDVGLGFAVARYDDEWEINPHRWDELKSLWVTEIETLLYPPPVSGGLTPALATV